MENFKYKKSKNYLKRKITDEQGFPTYQDLNEVVLAVNSIQTTVTSVIPYKKYVCKLSQQSISNPDAIVLENTIDTNLVWQRLSVGSYRLTRGAGSNVFLGNIYIAGFGNFAEANPIIPIWNGIGGISGYYTIYKSSNDEIILDIYNPTLLGYIEMSTIFGVTDWYIPEIRLYP